MVFLFTKNNNRQEIHPVASFESIYVCKNRERYYVVGDKICGGRIFFGKFDDKEEADKLFRYLLRQIEAKVSVIKFKIDAY